MRWKLNARSVRRLGVVALMVIGGLGPWRSVAAVEAPEMEAHWPLDDGAGTTAVDVVGGNDGTLMGGLESGWIGVSMLGGALGFDPDNDDQTFDNQGYIEVPHSADIDFGDEDFSISLLIRQAVSQPNPDPMGFNENRYFSKGSFSGALGGGGGVRYEMFNRDGVIRFTVDDNITKTEAMVDPDTSIVTGDWVHVVCVRDAVEDELRVYADGELVGSTFDGTGSVSNPHPLWIGTNRSDDRPAGVGFYNGDLDDLRLFRKALTVAEIEAIGDLYEAPESLTVMLEPGAAREAGAQWSVDGGATWFDSGAGSGLTTGTYDIVFKEIPGWLTPEAREVTFTGIESTVVHVSYEPDPEVMQVAGELLVDLRADDPSAATEVWTNHGSLGDFDFISEITPEDRVLGVGEFGEHIFMTTVRGVPAVYIGGASSHLAAYRGPDAPASIIGSSDRSIEAWVLNSSTGAFPETIAAWGNHFDEFSRGTIFSFGYGNHNEYGAIWYRSELHDMAWNTANGGDESTSVLPELGRWHHLVYTYDGDRRVRLYSDGEMVHSRELHMPIETHMNDILLFVNWWDARGRLDREGIPDFHVNSIRIHSGELTEAQVRANYRQGQSGGMPLGFGMIHVGLESEEAIAAGAEWSVDSGATWNDSGDEVLLTTGTYELSFRGIADWDAPEAREVLIEEREWISETGTYARHMGTVIVTAQAGDAISARWTLLSTSETYDSGEAVVLPTGEYGLQFEPIAGYSTPSVGPFVVEHGETTQVAGYFNKYPEVTSLGISPGAPGTLDDIMATAGVFDVDGDSIVQMEYEWSLEGEVVDVGGSAELGHESTLKEQNWMFRARPLDSHGNWGEWAEFGFVIGNTPPTQPVVEILPTTPTAESDLAVRIVEFSEDADGDEILYDFLWYESVDGGENWTLRPELNFSPVVNALYIDEGDSWRVEVVPYERGGAGEPAAERAGVGDVGLQGPGRVEGARGFFQVYVGENHPPELTFGAPTGVRGLDGDVALQVGWTWGDADGDAATVQLYWTDLGGYGLHALGGAMAAEAGGAEVSAALPEGVAVYVFGVIVDSKGAMTQVTSGAVAIEELRAGADGGWGDYR